MYLCGVRAKIPETLKHFFKILKKGGTFPGTVIQANWHIAKDAINLNTKLVVPKVSFY